MVLFFNNVPIYNIRFNNLWDIVTFFRSLWYDEDAIIVLFGSCLGHADIPTADIEYTPDCVTVLYIRIHTALTEV